MALPSLSDEQIRTWTLERKDRWWRDNVWRGDMPQLTPRAMLTGAVLGGVLSLTNLYVGIRTGWALGVGITSVVLSFAAFKLLARLGLGREMTILENNAMQSIATAAGYMTSPLIAAIPAYMMVTGRIVPPLHAGVWIVALALLGVLYAFPLKKRFINDDQLPFPEGYAAAVVLDGLHQDDEGAAAHAPVSLPVPVGANPSVTAAVAAPSRAGDGVFKAKLLAAGAAISAAIELLRSGRVMEALHLGRLTLPGFWDDLLYRVVTPRLWGTPLRDLTIRLDSSIVMMATGGLMGTKTAMSMLAGGVVNYFLLAPPLIARGIIATPTYKAISLWSLWGGAALMTTASLTSFLGKPQMLLGALALPLRVYRRWRAAAARGGAAAGAGAGAVAPAAPDPLADIELPMRLFVIGIPLLGSLVVLLGWALFGIHPLLGLLALPLVFLLTLIAVTSTALTAITPGSAIGKLTQLTFGALAPGNGGTNVLAAGLASEVSLNASNLLMDIKPGYMLGAKPRQQAVGHVIGIFAGAVAVIPVYYLILGGDIARLGSDRLPMPSAQVLRGVADVMAKGLAFLHPSARIAVAVGAVLGIVIELCDRRAKGRFPLSGVAFGLGFVIRFSDTLSMALGAGLLALLARRRRPRESRAQMIFVENRETLCGGMIAGGSMVGIVLIIVETLLGG